MLQQLDWGMSLYAPGGARKYINADERRRFLLAADDSDPLTRTLCMTLVFTGCRLSEALSLSMSHVHPVASVVAIKSLKKRRKGTVREVPVPALLIEALMQVQGTDLTPSEQTPFPLLWPWQRTWGWMRVKEVMAQAGIAGPQATPKGLRHGFGVHAVQSAVPLNLIQKWLGHASLSTTAIYTDAVGPEEYAIAERMW